MSRFWADVEATRDTLYGGRLVLWQPARGRGYRFNLDPVLLAGFSAGGGHLIDLGTGCGVLALSMLAAGKADRATGVEIQKPLAVLARRNAAENNLPLMVVERDLREVELPLADAVVFNPPYFRLGDGRAPPDRGRRLARHEGAGTLADFVGCASRCLQKGGAVSVIVRANRRAELGELLVQYGLRLARERQVLPRAGEPPAHVLVEARSDARSAAVEPPLIVHQCEGRSFSDEVRALLGE
jgi:tRNA1(Val) A37 N6-methylase TrmN6